MRPDSFRQIAHNARTTASLTHRALAAPYAPQYIENQINDYLAAMAGILFQDAFGDFEENAVLADIANITMGQSPAGTSYNEDGNGVIVYQGRGEFGLPYPTQRLFTTEPKRMAKVGDVLMSVRAPVGDLNVAYEDCRIGRGLAAISCDYPSYCLYLMRSLNRRLDVYNGEYFLYDAFALLCLISA